jgi:hypothetical protein
VAAYKPPPAVIAAAAAYVRALLRVRYSSPLFRMPRASDIKQQVVFENTGPDQIPGVICMRLISARSPDHGTYDPELASVVVVINARPAAARLPFPAGVRGLELHPVLAELAGEDDALAGCQADVVRGVVDVPGRVAAVFVERRRA